MLQMLDLMVYLSADVFQIAIILVIMIAMLISFFWVTVVDEMKTKHKDYKGEDLFDE